MKPIVYLAFIAILLLSCQTRNKQKDQTKTADTHISDPEQKTEISNEDGFIADTAKVKQAGLRIGTTYTDWDKKIIKTAEVTLELKDYATYNQTLHKGLRAFGAYIASEEQQLSDERSANTMTIKVPVEQFESLMNAFSGEGIRVLQKKISSDDVTGEVVDTRSRMEAKKQTRNRYLDLLKQARNMKEILEVQQEINSIQEQIESASGRVTYLTHQAAYSTIHLQYFQYNGTAVKPEAPKYLARLKTAFDIGKSVIGHVLIFIVTLWPLLLIAITGLLIWKKRKADQAKA